ncbi:hypothetical protein R1sor_017063 [Riccia sorocarpa]|uniref:Uncharacterized protein n=1 Tax=Riccia sorocarpa TaxID=122646 RepID=A0ABD3I9Q7_9MARC
MNGERCGKSLGRNQHLAGKVFGGVENLMMESTKLKPRNAALWDIAAEMYKVTWRERNDAVFRDSISVRPLRIILLETSRSVASWISKSMPERHNQLVVKSLETVMELQRKLDGVEVTLRGRSTPHEHGEDEDLGNTSVEWPEDGNGVLSITHREEERRADYRGSDEGAHGRMLHDASSIMRSPVGRGTSKELSTNYFSADNQVLLYELAGVRPSRTSVLRDDVDGPWSHPSPVLPDCLYP